MKWENKGHEFDEVGYLLKGKKNVFLYGAGGIAWELLEVLHAVEAWTNWKIYLVDRDEKKQREGRFGHSVLSPERFFSMEKEDYFVIACAQNNAGDEIYALVKERLDKDAVIFKAFYFLHSYLPIYFVYMHDMVFFTSESMLPSTACNLNCRDCLNFTPYIKKHYVEPLEQLKEDVDLFFGAVDLVYRFQITGGEPLLYKDLVSLIEYIAENYRNRILRFEIVMNGTVIPDDSVCEVLKKRDMYVFLDDYRMSVKGMEEQYEKVYWKLNKYRIAFADNYVEQWIRMYIPEEDEGTELSEQVLRQKYRKCNAPWSSLWQGKISSCNYAMYAQRAGLCGKHEDESYDLRQFSAEKRKELVEFRLRYCEKGYMEFCQKCGGWTDTNERWCQPAIQCKREG
ncbi:MAG: radical SAM protein [Roseburia sp.]|nr:radical SAM protein [Roseburia sp.]